MYPIIGYIHCSKAGAKRLSEGIAIESVNSKLNRSVPYIVGGRAQYITLAQRSRFLTSQVLHVQARWSGVWELNR